MEMFFLLCIISLAFTGLSEGAGVLPDDSLSAAVGGTVMFTTTLTPQQTPIGLIAWTFSDRNIITSQTSNITAPEYKDRITLFTYTGSLELRNLALNDSGEYRVSIIPTGQAIQSGRTTLDIYVPVSNVTVTASSTDFMEFNSSVHLSCSSSGSSLAFLWLNGSSEVTGSERVQLTDGGSTLTIVNVTRYDQGPFRCHVSNPINNGTSDPVNLFISFGPENINLKLFPSQQYYEEGSNISMICSAVSRPDAQFKWFLNRNLLLDTGPELRLVNIQESQSGNYSCQAFNNKTMRSQTSQPSVISVLKRVSNVKVTASSTDLVEFNSSVRLSCSSSGSSLSFLWLNGSSEVTGSDRVQLTDGGSTLTIYNVTRYDQGPFRCRVSNPINNGTSDPVNLFISFGPENINLKLFPSQQYYEEGSNISMICSAVSRPDAQFKWFLNRNLLLDTGPELRLVNIQESQSGNYSCQAFNNKTMRSQTSQPSVISVLKRVSNVKVTASSTDLVEFNSSVRLSCSSSGSSLSFLWLNGSSEVTGSERVQLTDGGSTLTIVNVTRYDQRPFRCRVSNPINNGTSDPVNLFISFGPENINLKLFPSQQYYEEGSNISMICSAVSRPDAQFKWFLNRNLLLDTGPELRLVNIQESQSGNYSCQAFNNKTMRSQTSQPSVISVLKRVSNVKVTASSTDLVEFNSSVRLSCSSSGSSLSFLWLNGSSEVTGSERVQLTDGGSTLTIVNVTRYDQRPFRCRVSNPINNGTSDPVNLFISYGPENVQITGPSEINLKQPLELICSAESTPSASYNWILNEIEILNNSAVLTKDATELSDSGNYTCRATNNITERTTTSAVHGLTVTAKDPSPCPGGCIAGIVIACIVVIGVVVGVWYIIHKKKTCTKKPSNRDTGTRTGSEGQDNAAFSGSQELNYADVMFFQNKDGGRVQLGQQNSRPPAASSPPSYDAHMQRMKTPAPTYAQVRRN